MSPTIAGGARGREALPGIRADVAQVIDRVGGGRFTIRTRYLVAADGHRSSVRESLGVSRTVLRPPTPVVNIVFEADLTSALRGRRIALCYLDHPAPDTLLTPLDRGNRWLLMVPSDPRRDGRVDDLTEERCLEMVRAAVGQADLPARILPAIPGNPTPAHFWELAAWVVDRYRDGRVFLAGDAAHVMPPAGGLGANTGIQDAHNLAWKLAAVCRAGRAPACSTRTRRSGSRSPG